MSVLVVNTSTQSQTSSCEFSIFGFRTLLPNSTITGANEDPEYPFSGCTDFPDNTKYSPLPSSGTVEILMSQTQISQIDYFGMAIHNAQSANLYAKLDYWNGSGWVKIFDFTSLQDDKPFMSVFDSVNTSKQRLTLTFTSKLYIGTIFIGKSLQGLSTPDLGFQPAKFAQLDEVEQFTTDGNNTIMGRRIDKGKQAKGSFSLVSFDELDDWYEEYQNWVLDSKPLFFKWSDAKDEVVYGRQNPDKLTKPTYTQSFYTTLNFEINGYA